MEYMLRDTSTVVRSIHCPEGKHLIHTTRGKLLNIDLPSESRGLKSAMTAAVPGSMLSFRQVVVILTAANASRESQEIVRNISWNIWRSRTAPQALCSVRSQQTYRSQRSYCGTSTFRTCNCKLYFRVCVSTTVMITI